MTFTPSRLVLARMKRAIPKVELAKEAGLGYRTLIELEQGESTSPEPYTIGALARALSFPESFFCAPPVDLLVPENASFRSFTRMTARQRDAALAAGTLAVEFSAWLDERFNLPSPSIPEVVVPDFREDRWGPEKAAEAVRSEWGIGARPIPNIVHLLESRGVRVFSLREANQKIDAFSIWRDEVPFVFLNSMKTAERSRFDAAHELGHLVMHRRITARGRSHEDQANAFASAFLMPKGDVLAHARPSMSVRDIEALKPRWRVSAQALAYRLHKLHLITEWRHRNACIELGRRGREDIQRETSQVLMKVMGALKSEGVTRAEIARQLHIYPDDLSDLVFGLGLTPLGGGRQGRPGPPERPPGGGPKLRLVQ